MRLTTTVLCMLAFSGPVVADEVAFPVTIPHECYELAQREGVPIVIENRYQAVKARTKLARMSSHDPLVSECRAAVNRAKQAATDRLHVQTESKEPFNAR
jgi:hypothetical protein